ncbi:MAG: pteridine reductase, partial [Gammaproteobacteria bacterium]
CNTLREGSVALLQGDLLDIAKLPKLVQQAIAVWGRLDVLINNASTFYPTPVGEVTEAQWDDLMGSNLKAPFFLAQAAAPALTAQQGCIINMADIHAERPLKGYPVYSAAKAGLVMLTKALARELGPAVRVNAVAPGPVLWPANMDEQTKQHIESRTALKRAGHPSDVARAILFLIRDAGYITGQVIAVDGGRSVYS